jgi:hypothetical protein
MVRVIHLSIKQYTREVGLCTYCMFQSPTSVVVAVTLCTLFAYLLHHHSERLLVLRRDDGLDLSAKRLHAEGGKWVI